jgi:hypothetical protein
VKFSGKSSKLNKNGVSLAQRSLENQNISGASQVMPPFFENTY